MTYEIEYLLYLNLLESHFASHDKQKFWMTLASGRLTELANAFDIAPFRHEVPTHPMPGLTSPGFKTLSN